MKNRKTIVSLMLVFAMVFSLNIAPKVSNAEESATSINCYVRIQAPYEVYYEGNESVTLDAADLNDDFGIGVVTGSGATFTAIRAIAKSVREHVKNTKNITDNKEANKLMPNYINYKDGFINGFSNDGKTWNTGVFKGDVSTSGTATGATNLTDGSWAFYVDGVYSSTLADQTSAGDGSYVTDFLLTWASTTGTYGQADFDVAGTGVITNKDYGNDYEGYELASKKTTFTVKKLPTDLTTFMPSSTYVAVSGASVSVYDDLNDRKEVYTTTTDDKGQFSLKKNFGPGSYTIVATEEATNAAGKTYSKMTFTSYNINLVTAPTTPTGIKAKFNKKKNKFTVTWKKTKDFDNYYEIYHSTKKNGKYRLAKTVEANNKVTIKKGKGIKYIKIIPLARYFYGPGTEHSRDFYGKFSKPVKIK